MSKRNREKRQQPHAPPTLEDAMQQVYESIAHAETGEESRIAHLHLYLPDGSVVLCALALVGGGPQYAAAARALVLQHAPACAVLASETWSARIDQERPHEQQDPIIRDWLRRRAAGEPLGVVDLPPDYRAEMLLLVGEDKKGRELDWFFDIRPATRPGGPRSFERTQMVGVECISSRFRPLFALQWAERNGVPADSARAAVLHELEMARLGTQDQAHQRTKTPPSDSVSRWAGPVKKVTPTSLARRAPRRQGLSGTASAGIS